MRTLLAVLVSLSFALGFPSPVVAQDYASLLRDFRADALTTQDKRFLQAALAFEGHYNGLLDGDWGAMSQRALTAYSRSEFGSAAQDWHMAILAFTLFQRVESDGWQIEYFEPLGMSFLFPTKTAVSDPATEQFVNWRHSGSSLSYSVAVADVARTNRFHDYTLSKHDRTAAPYTVRKPGFAVTSAQGRDGTILYTRSNFVNGSWSTVMISAKSWDKATLNAVAASISVGMGAPIHFTESGRLWDAVVNVLAVIEKQDGPNDPERTSAVAPGNTRSPSTGSGFFVSNDGHVLTNAHVVWGCEQVSVNGNPATILGISQDFDLAVLKTARDAEKAVAAFSPAPARLNADVTVAGYPYAGLLGGLNITRGAISSVTGLQGEGTTMQITAPVQSGNSGGPVIAGNGAVIGVVVSKLDAIEIAEIVGDVPQNVNFSVRGEIAKLFLFQNGVEPLLSSSDDVLTPEDLAEKADEFTVFIECR
ncbi:serine protease [Thalassococcus sp. CAU 1522]|uniref:Serine protease n=1 Tax=Thalassococcus arenae TaxID=2851652 RepID=A0ABS6N381_9RHOB|nr:serine protease [Thalassococcus arenae]MBV2358477.1 serine protease [Thalassococcus arenae]